MSNNKPLLSELSLREKIGQTAMALSNNDFSDLSKTPYGGIWWVGRRNVVVDNMGFAFNDSKTPVSKYIEKIKIINSNLKIPILPAMDCTSGIQTCFFEMSPYVMDAVTLGASGSTDLAAESGACRANELKCVGARWWWGPEIDMVSPRSTISLGRKFGDNQDFVIKMATAELKACQANGVATTAKHFPGSDGIEYRDQHVTEAVLSLTESEWEIHQGRVFQALFDAGVYSVMIGHDAFPAIDDTKIKGRYLPSTISYKVITELLKGKMGFKGVVISDAVRMKSLATIFDNDIRKTYIAALKAGNDVILPANNEYIDTIEKAVCEGEISESRIDDACRRVLDMKEKLGMFRADYIPAMDDIDAVREKTKANNENVAKGSVTLVCDHQKLLPADKKSIKRVAIICSMHSDRVFDMMGFMKEAFERRGAVVHLQRRLRNKQEIINIANENDLIVYVGYLMRHEPNGASAFYAEEFNTFHYALDAGAEKSVGVGLGSPFMYYDFYPAFRTFINAYNPSQYTQEAVVSAIYGEIPFKGRESFKIFP